MSSTSATATSPHPSPSSSFDQASYKLLQSRVILGLAVGFAISATYKLIWLLFSKWTQPFLPSSISWINLISLGHTLSFGLGVILVILIPGNPRRILLIDMVIMTFNVLLVLIPSAVLCEGSSVLFPISILLFIHAAFVPCRVRAQMILAFAAILGFPLSQVLAAQYVPDFYQRWLLENPYKTFVSEFMLGTVGAMVVGLTSLLITATLYNLRKSLHQAKRIGNYIIEGELGKGGMGKVYLARHALIRRPTAVKVMTPLEDADQQTAIGRFEREVQLSSKLTHPNTITIFDFGSTEDNTFYYVMEHLEGLTLKQIVNEYGALPQERAVFILFQICGSLAEAHSQEIVHRDIKPSNIFLTQRGNIYDFVKVLDFGLAKELKVSDDAGLTQSGAIFGTPRYIAPETVYGADSVDQRADIYTLGAVTYWMLTGQHMFSSTSGVEQIIDHVKTDPKRPSEVTDLDIESSLEDIVMKCLKKNPIDRYQDVAALVADLEELHFDDPWTRKKAEVWWFDHKRAMQTECKDCTEEELRPQRKIA